MAAYGQACSQVLSLRGATAMHHCVAWMPAGNPVERGSPVAGQAGRIWHIGSSVDAGCPFGGSRAVVQGRGLSLDHNFTKF